MNLIGRWLRRILRRSRYTESMHWDLADALGKIEPFDARLMRQFQEPSKGIVHRWDPDP